LVDYVCQLALLVDWPFSFAADVSFFLFSRLLVLGRHLTNLHETLPYVRQRARFINVGRNFWGRFPKKHFAAQNIKFLVQFQQLCNFVANISGLQQDVNSLKIELQTTITPAHAHSTW